MQQVRAVVARSKGAPVEVATVHVPDPGPGEAAVEVKAFDTMRRGDVLRSAVAL